MKTSKQTILIGLAFLSICTFWQFYDNEIPKILKNTFGLKETMTGVIMALDNVLALFLLPFFGALSDKTGRRMPYIVYGTGMACILLVILSWLAGQPTHFLWFILVLLALLVTMGVYRSPAVSLMPDMTVPEKRSQANAIINLMGAVGAILALVLIRLFVQSGYEVLGLSLVVVMAVSVFILRLTIHEPEQKEQPEQEQEGLGRALSKKSRRSLIYLLLAVFCWFTAYNGVTTAFSRYVEVVWHLKGGAYTTSLMVATVSAIVSYLPIGFLSGKIGRKKMVLVGIVCTGICYGCAFLLNEYTIWVNGLFALIGFGWAAINVNSYPMVVDMAKLGSIGRYTGLYYTFSMAAQVFTPIASGFLLEKVAYQTLFPYATCFSLFAFGLMLLVKERGME